MDSSGDVFFRGSNAWYNCGYMLCVSSLAMEEFHICFYDAADSDPEAFSPFGLNGEVCPVDASVAVCSARFAFGNTRLLSTSFSWLSCVMKDRVFSLLSVAFFGLLLGVEALRFWSAN